MTVDATTARSIQRWRDNPILFVREVFGVEPDAWQEDALLAFANPKHRRIALRACAGPGKSAVLAWCGWNFMLCYGDVGDHPKGAVVSCNWDNLANNIWPEFAKWQARSPLLTETFKWTRERIEARDHWETWFLSARGFAKTANADEQGRALSGLHSGYVLYLIDESGDINPSVERTAEQGLSRCVWGKILQAGNPTSHTGMLYEASVLHADQWKLISITGDPDDPKRSPRIDEGWAREQIARYGRDNPWVMSYILGQFPPGGINALLTVQEVEAAMFRNPTGYEYEHSQRRMGVDVARFGDDRTVLFMRQGLKAFAPVEMRNARSNEIAARIAAERVKFRCEMQLIDDTGGYGSGVIDSLIQARVPATGINFSGKATDPRYFNKRSEMWFEMRDWIQRGGALPNVPELVRELTTPTYSFHNGKFRLEEKDQIKDRLGFSPDYADALALTFSLPEMPTAPPHWVTSSAVRRGDYDPLSDDRVRPNRGDFDPHSYGRS